MTHLATAVRHASPVPFSFNMNLELLSVEVSGFLFNLHTLPSNNINTFGNLAVQYIRQAWQHQNIHPAVLWEIPLSFYQFKAIKHKLPMYFSQPCLFLRWSHASSWMKTASDRAGKAIGSLKCFEHLFGSFATFNIYYLFIWEALWKYCFSYRILIFPFSDVLSFYWSLSL